MLPYFSVDYPTREAAEAAALQSCREAGRPGCRVLGTFGTGCGTFAFDLEGKIFSGVDGTMPSVAAVRAMENCNAGSTTGGCMLVSKSICAGLPLSKAVFNDVSRQTIEDIEEISSMMDQRSYWGSFASDGAKITGSHGLFTEKDSETAALKQCAGCQIVISFKNSCGAIAWPADNRQRYEADTDVLPAEARKKALVKCEGKYGACRVSVRCSGRSYREADPYANTKAAAVSQPNAPAGPTTSDGTDAPGTRIPRNTNVSADGARH